MCKYLRRARRRRAAHCQDFILQNHPPDPPTEDSSCRLRSVVVNLCLFFRAMSCESYQRREDVQFTVVSFLLCGASALVEASHQPETWVAGDVWKSESRVLWSVIESVCNFFRSLPANYCSLGCDLTRIACVVTVAFDGIDIRRVLAAPRFGKFVQQTLFAPATILLQFPKLGRDKGL